MRTEGHSSVTAVSRWWRAHTGFGPLHGLLRSRSKKIIFKGVYDHGGEVKTDCMSDKTKVVFILAQGWQCCSAHVFSILIFYYTEILVDDMI